MNTFDPRSPQRWPEAHQLDAEDLRKSPERRRTRRWLLAIVAVWVAAGVAGGLVLADLLDARATLPDSQETSDGLR